MNSKPVVTAHQDHKKNEQNQRILRIGKVCAKTDSSRSFIYKAILELGFPKPIMLGPRSRGWRECDIDSWLASRSEAK